MRKIMWMKSCIILLSILIIVIFPASASYAGDKTLTTVYHDVHPGGVEFTLGNSKYSGEMKSNDTYTVDFEVVVPDGASIRYVRAYTYWVWSKNGLEGIYPLFNASVVHQSVVSPVSHDLRYTDTKGFASRYDFFSGTDVYDLTDQVHENGDYSIILKNSADDERTFCLQGIGLLTIYEYQGSPVIEYWVNEGCDMIYAEHGITPEMATTTTYFKGDVDTEKVSRAYLVTASPSGGLTQGAKQTRNKLFFNEKAEVTPILGDIIRILFGGGKVWKDIYMTSESAQIAIDEREVTNYLKSKDNFASIQDSGDYMLVTNAIMVLEFEDEGGTKANKTAGFELLAGIIAMSIAYVAGKR
jgi:hypothetical protein